MRRLVALALPFILLAGAGVRAAGDDAVTVYRCTDAKGRVSLGSTPCAAGQAQQVRTLQRPTDGTAPVRPAPAPASVATPPPPVASAPPRPLYDCVRPDGSRYTSDTADGQPRYVPLWTLGYPPRVPRSALGDRIGAPPARPASREPGGPPRPPHRDGFHDGRVGLGVAGGTWVRDECHALPQAEVCARLRDRRDDIRRRIFNAQQRERDTLRLEERGVVARLAGDCGVR